MATVLPVSHTTVELNGADINDDLVPYLHRKLSKNKWTSKKIAKQYRNRQSRGNRMSHHHHCKPYVHKTKISAKKETISTNNKHVHRGRLINNTHIKSQTEDLFNEYQSDLEYLLAEQIDGIYGTDEMNLDKDLVIFDSGKRRWRKKKKPIILTENNDDKDDDDNNNNNSPSYSSYKSDSYGTGSIKSFSLSSITSTVTIDNNNNNKSYQKNVIKTDWKPLNTYEDDSSDDSDDSDISTSTNNDNFVSNTFKNNQNYPSESDDSDDSDDDDYDSDYVPPKKTAKESTESKPVSMDIDGFDMEKELKLLGFLTDSGEEIKECKDDIEKLEEKYVEEISNIDEMNNYAPIEALASRCSYKDYNKDDETTQMDPKTLKKVFNEIRIDLPKNLTLQWNGSMFVRFDEENPRFLQALLTGLKDTPYENGMFLFDIYLHKDYPNTALNIKHVTKGGSTVYGSHTPGGFSPNLHRSSGKVCLSLLGTWGTNQWDPKTSNIYQVLSSILWMILGAQWAYYMEPSHGGWEGTANMSESDPSKHSSAVIKYQYEVIEKCIKYAMLDTIKTPYTGFEEVIKTHFKLKKNEILKNILNKWIKQSPNIEKKQNLVGLYKSLKEEFDKL